MTREQIECPMDKLALRFSDTHDENIKREIEKLSHLDESLLGTAPINVGTGKELSIIEIARTVCKALKA
jgi:hypothetical protein